MIDLYGTAGGLNEYRAALLASRGFAALALAYFGYDDLPTGMTFDLDYFDASRDQDVVLFNCTKEIQQ